MLLFKEVWGWKNGIISHSVMEHVSASPGAMEYNLGLLEEVERGILENNFPASASGRRRAAKDGLFGPFRSWAYPSPRRSKRVNKAMASKPIIKEINVLISNIKVV